MGSPKAEDRVTSFSLFETEEPPVETNNAFLWFALYGFSVVPSVA